MNTYLYSFMGFDLSQQSFLLIRILPTFFSSEDWGCLSSVWMHLLYSIIYMTPNMCLIVVICVGNIQDITWWGLCSWSLFFIVFLVDDWLAHSVDFLPAGVFSLFEGYIGGYFPPPWLFLHAFILFNQLGLFFDICLLSLLFFSFFLLHEFLKLSSSLLFSFQFLFVLSILWSEVAVTDFSRSFYWIRSSSSRTCFAVSSSYALYVAYGW